MLSWQSSKHSRDVLRGFVFPVFTERLERSRSEAQDPGLHNGSSEKFWGRTHTHTQTYKHRHTYTGMAGKLI